MRHASTWPYTGTLNNSETAVIYLTYGPSYSFDVNTGGNISWYGSPIYLVSDNNNTNDIYSIADINSSGITFCDYQTNVAYMTLSNVTYQVTYNLSNAMTLYQSTLTNSAQSGYAVLNFTGSGVLSFLGTVVLNCYSYGSCSGSSSDQHSGDNHVTVNYYYTASYNNFNFGVLGGEFSIE